MNTDCILVSVSVSADDRIRNGGINLMQFESIVIHLEGCHESRRRNLWNWKLDVREPPNIEL